MKILVVGGTGTVGSEVARQLLRRGEKVRILTSSPEKLKNVQPGAEGTFGDLRMPATLGQAFKGVDGVFLVTALGQDEPAQGLAALNSAKAAKVRRAVYLSVHRAAEFPQIPHFASKLPVERALEESGMEYSILSANNFFQNDFFFREPILKHGLYPQPTGQVGCSRVDVRDIAEAAANCLTQAGHNERNYALAGPDVLNGARTAEILSRHLGRDVRYAGDDLDAWAAQARRMLPEWMVENLRIMYEQIQKKGLPATPAELVRVRSLLGRPPRTYEAFVAELAPAWAAHAVAR